MIMALSGPTRPPLAGGEPRRLVILLHGLGADGNDLIGLQQYWGRLIAPELLASELRSRPRALLIHGTEDQLVPFDSLAHAEAALKQAGVPVETLACPGIEHSISPDGLERGGRFLREVLGAPPT